MSGNMLSRDLKILCTRSGNRCALQNCRKILVVNATENDRESFAAELAHIKGEKPESPRYDSAMTDVQRNSYDNRILVCNTCHKIIDDQLNTYTVEKLHQIKKEHEEFIIKQTNKVIPQVTFAELNVVMKYLLSDTASNESSLELIPPKDKINRNNLSAHTEHQIVMAMTRVRQVGQYLNKVPDPYFSERLKQGFVKEYERLKNSEKLEGDLLFDALFDFASGESSDFKQRAAGLTVLTYLFEKCEVFEK